MGFLDSVKKLFAGQEVEITVKSMDTPEREVLLNQTKLLEMIHANRQSAPVIGKDINIRSLIDEAQYPL